MDQEARAARTRELNDALRRHRRGGRILLSRGLAALGPDFVAQALAAVAVFEAFGPENDPYGEHDFGLVVVAGRTVLFKIDAYDLDLAAGSPDPADPAVTARVLTIMLAEDY